MMHAPECLSFPAGRRTVAKPAAIWAILAIMASGFSSAAGAKPGTVYWTSYLRAGPGTQYQVIDELTARSPVEVERCEHDWCRVRSDGAAGYIEAAMLTAADIHSPPAPRRKSDNCERVQLNGTEHGEAVRVCGP